MRTLVYSDVKATVARAIGGCVDDARVLEVTNEAQERLLNRPNDPLGSWQRYRVCAGSSDCAVWPRQVLNVRAWWLCNTPGRIYNEWYETIGYAEGGYGLADADSWRGTALIDRGPVCCFQNVIATTAAPRKIQVVATDTSDNGKSIVLRYYDANGQKKITSIGGTYQEGEALTLSTSGTLTSSTVMTAGLYQVVKAQTNFPVRVYSYDPNAGTQTALLAVYEPSETVPVYRSTFIPGLTRAGACPNASDDCSANKTITAIVRVQHVPVAVDNDPLVIGNLAAFKLMALGIHHENLRELDMAEAYFTSAQRELDGEVAAYLGDGQTTTIRMPPTDVWGGAVFNPVGGLWQ